MVEVAVHTAFPAHRRKTFRIWVIGDSRETESMTLEFGRSSVTLGRSGDMASWVWEYTGSICMECAKKALVEIRLSEK